MRRSECKCGRLLIWATSAKTGAKMPLNEAPDEQRGNVLLDARNRAYVFRNHAAAVAAADASDDEFLAASATYLPHAADPACTIERAA